MVLPVGVLRAAVTGPVLVELKNGDSYSGTLAAVDNLMNVRLEPAIFTSKGEHKFERLKGCMIRGQFVKFIRFPEDILEVISQQEANAAALGKDARAKGRGRGGKSQGRGGKEGGQHRISVPSSLVGTIIGRGGETIKRLSAESGAQIDVAKDAADAADERFIYLFGLPECVERAQELISAIVREKASIGKGGGGYKGGQGPAQPQLQAGDRGQSKGGQAHPRGQGGKGKDFNKGSGTLSAARAPPPAGIVLADGVPTYMTL